MYATIIFDFNRTLFDPDTGKLIPGAKELLHTAKAKSYRLALLAQAKPARARIIQDLDLDGFFQRIDLVDHKSHALLRDIARALDADISHSFVIGDRAQGELHLAAQAGWRTIWLQAGRFEAQLPYPGFEPTHTVHHLADVSKFL